MAARRELPRARNTMHPQYNCCFDPLPGRPPRTQACLSAVFIAAAMLIAVSAWSADTMSQAAPAQAAARYFMPDAAASRIMTVANEGGAAADIVILTEAVAVKETGPKETIEHFGEVYAFSPAFIAVHRDQPTRITLWNLQPDDDHDFMIEDRPGHALMHLRLKPLSKTSYIYTFHREGLFAFRCAVHQPEMNGQILVLPPR
jgi:plastocyanin